MSDTIIEQHNRAESFYTLVQSGIIEAERAMARFPQPNYVISKIAEEAGEVVKAAIHCAEGRETPENVRGEMRQLIAMLYRLWVEGDQVHGLPAIAATISKPIQWVGSEHVLDSAGLVSATAKDNGHE
jgi:phosphoribosyl-ATP pyrophosphohydrolase